VDADLVRTTFAPLLADPGRAVLACDYDGTLAPIAPRPDLAVPAPGAVEVLVELAPRLGRVAVITGRPADDAVAVGGLDRVPDLVVLGQFGAQRWEQGRTRVTVEPPSSLVAALAELRALMAAGFGGPAAVGARIEDKRGSFGLHVRGAADPAAALAALDRPVAELAARHGLVVQPGRLVLEVRPQGADKGSALTELAAGVGQPSAVLFAGDDLGDLDAFAAVRALRDRGVPGWAVASASPEAPEVSAAADVVVDGPPGVVALLRTLATELSA
jgi:trehalose 6-phosphate phosphatase